MWTKVQKSNLITYFVLLAMQCSRTPNADALINLENDCAHNEKFSCTFYDPEKVENATAPQLCKIILRHSDIDNFKGLMTLAPALHTFVVENSSLERLTVYGFPTGHPLRILVIQDNNIQAFYEPRRPFASLRELDELHLRRNKIYDLYQHNFDGLLKLRYLDLQRNEISELPTSVFDDLVNLEYIDLSCNFIQKITETTFANNTKLQTLLLGDNNISQFDHLPPLRLLNLNGSYFRELHLQSVDTLLVSKSHLKSLVIAGSAVKVHADNNALTSLKIGDKLSVRELHLHSNRLESLVDLVGMLNLQHLDVSSNELKSSITMNSTLYLLLPSLKYLNLAENILVGLPKISFLVLQNLTHLDLAFNYLQCIDHSMFDHMHNLEYFYIEGNYHLSSFQYAPFIYRHTCLKEIGVYEYDFDRDSSNLTYLANDRHIKLPVRYTAYRVKKLRRSTSTEWSWDNCESAATNLTGLNMEFLTMAILLLVFLYPVILRVFYFFYIMAT